jgi:insertion element IS1 protein InsB
MIQTTITHTCHNCGSDRIVKNGKTRFGNQKYKCKDCVKTKVLKYKLKYSEEEKETILRAYQERSSIRGVCRTFGIAKQTLSNWLKKKQKDCQIV